MERILNLLIVDDNPGIRRLLRRLLAPHAVNVREGTDGIEGVSLYAECRPDLVLMDVRMPHMDGLTATRTICSAYPEAKIVIVTDHDEDEVRAAAREAGACGYVAKQDLTGLFAVIAAAMET